MNIYNRYLMRASGEGGHQASGKGEVAAYIAVNLIKENEKLRIVFDVLSKEEKFLLWKKS